MATSTEASFIGRDQELAQLEDWLSEVFNGQSRIAFISGDAGVGKSRLMTEFAHRAQAEHDDLIVATGLCDPQTGAGDPYLPFRNILEQLTGTGDEASADGNGKAKRPGLTTAQEMAKETLRDWGPDLVGLFVPGAALFTRMASRIAHRFIEQRQSASNVDVEGIDRDQIFEQYVHVFKQLGQEAPLLLVLDDAQWADASSIDLLFHLSRRLKDSPVFVVVTYRSAEIAVGRDGERHPLEKVVSEIKRYRGDVEIDLNATAHREARSFVDALIDRESNRLGDDFRATLERHTGGNPLLTTELLRAMQERGDLVLDDDGAWVEGPSLDWTHLPSQAEGVVQERLRQLSSGHQDLLRAASVEGPTFHAEVLARLWDGREREVVRALSAELEGQYQLVSGLGSMRIGDRRISRFCFNNRLMQDYLYQRINEAERRYWHEAVGEALEEIFGDRAEDEAVTLAWHFERAGDRRRARRYRQIAGERAAQRAAHAEAIEDLSRALDLTDDDDTEARFEIRALREHVYELQGQQAERSDDLARLERLAEELDSDDRRMQVGLQQVRYQTDTGAYDSAETTVARVVERAEATEDPSWMAEAYSSWGSILGLRGDYVRAQEKLQQALGYAETADRQGAQADVHYKLGVVTKNQADWVRARRHLEKAKELNEQIDRRRGVADAVNVLGGLFGMLGDYDRAHEHFEQSLTIMREVGDRTREGTALGNLGEIALRQADYAKARRLTEQALTIIRETGHRPHEAKRLLALGQALAGLDEPEPAKESFDRAIAIARETEIQPILIEALAKRSLLYGEIGEGERARADVEELWAYRDDADGFSMVGESAPIEWACLRVFEADGDARARPLCERAYRQLETTAAQIEDAELHRAFREIPVHREIRAAFDRLVPEGTADLDMESFDSNDNEPLSASPSAPSEPPSKVSSDESLAAHDGDDSSAVDEPRASSTSEARESPHKRVRHGDAPMAHDEAPLSVSSSSVDLGGVDLAESDLQGVDLSGASLRGASLQEICLDRAVLCWADLQGVDLTGGELRNAVLIGADLRSVDLGGADLRGAVLCGADLREADLRGADLRGAHLDGRTLGESPSDHPHPAVGALSQATWAEACAERARLADVLYDDTTRWPAGVTPNDL